MTTHSGKEVSSPTPSFEGGVLQDATIVIIPRIGKKYLFINKKPEVYALRVNITLYFIYVYL
jgi:hypothetical protein